MSDEQELMLLMNRDGGLTRHLLHMHERKHRHVGAKGLLASFAESEP